MFDAQPSTTVMPHVVCPQTKGDIYVFTALAHDMPGCSMAGALSGLIPIQTQQPYINGMCHAKTYTTVMPHVVCPQSEGDICVFTALAHDMPGCSMAGALSGLIPIQTQQPSINGMCHAKKSTTVVPHVVCPQSEGDICVFTALAHDMPGCSMAGALSGLIPIPDAAAIYKWDVSCKKSNYCHVTCGLSSN